MIELSKADEPDLLDLLSKPPLISIIITHFNYSDHLRGAIQSLLNQTHVNWECVVVDDRSKAEHVHAAKQIVEKSRDARIRILELNRNGGQVPAFFSGIEQTSGEFVCLLDPDDRYAPTFLAEVLAAHLNPYVMCPIVCTDQILVTERGIIGRGLRADMHLSSMPVHGRALAVPTEPGHRLLFIETKTPGWHWTSTSAMMFRRSALQYLKPHKELAYRDCADGYLAPGIHALGGTLFLTKCLLYRTLHERNAWMNAARYSSFQDKRRPGVEHWGRVAREDALEAIKVNMLPYEEQRRTQKDHGTTKRGFKRHISRWIRSLKKRLA